MISYAINYEDITMRKTLIWTARVLAILLIAFFTIFALDVFGEPQWFIALIMHLLPSFILIVFTVLAWKNARLGGFIFLLAALAILLHYGSYVIAAPALVIGLLFLAVGYWIKE
jgi:hypothetical protein